MSNNHYVLLIIALAVAKCGSLFRTLGCSIFTGHRLHILERVYNHKVNILVLIAYLTDFTNSEQRIIIDVRGQFFYQFAGSCKTNPIRISEILIPNSSCIYHMLTRA